MYIHILLHLYLLHCLYRQNKYTFVFVIYHQGLLDWCVLSSSLPCFKFIIANLNSKQIHKTSERLTATVTKLQLFTRWIESMTHESMTHSILILMIHDASCFHIKSLLCFCCRKESTMPCQKPILNLWIWFSDNLKVKAKAFCYCFNVQIGMLICSYIVNRNDAITDSLLHTIKI